MYYDLFLLLHMYGLYIMKEYFVVVIIGVLNVVLKFDIYNITLVHLFICKRRILSDVCMYSHLERTRFINRTRK